MEDLVVKVITEAKLAECDHTTAEGVFVFTKGFTDDKDIIDSDVKKGLDAASVPVKGLKVWRTQKVGGARKDKEVLILLKNPGIKELLPERIEAAIDFIHLIEVVKRIETGSEDKSTPKTLGATLKGPIEVDTEGKKLLEKIKTTIEGYRDESDVEQELIYIIANAWEFSHSEKEFKFTEKAIRGNWSFIKEFREELEEVKKRIKSGEREIFKEHVKIQLG